MGELLLSTM